MQMVPIPYYYLVVGWTPIRQRPTIHPHQLCLRRNRCNNYACNSNRHKLASKLAIAAVAVAVAVSAAWLPIHIQHTKSARCRSRHWHNTNRLYISSYNNVLPMLTLIQVSDRKYASLQFALRRHMFVFFRHSNCIMLDRNMLVFVY